MTSRRSEVSAAQFSRASVRSQSSRSQYSTEGPGLANHDVFILDVLGKNLSGVEVLDDLAPDHRGEHEYAYRRVRSVDDLMHTVLAARKADDVTLLQRLLAFGRTQRRLAAEHDHPFLVQVMRVVGPELLPGSTSDKVAPIHAPPMCWPTRRALTRQPSRSLVPSHSSLLRLKVVTR